MYKIKKSGLVLLTVFLTAGSLFTLVSAEDETIAESSVPLVTGEATCLGSNLADLTADAMLWYSANNDQYKKADFSLVSEKVFAGTIPAGTLTEADIRAAFREDAVMIEVKSAGGRWLKAIDESTLNVPAADVRFVTPANLRYIIQPSQPGMEEGKRYDEETARILSVILGKKSDIGWVQNYTAVTDQYLLEASPALTATGGVEEVSAADGVPIADIVIAYIRETMNGTIPDRYASEHGDDRITVLADANIEYNEETAVYTYELKEDIPDYKDFILLPVPESLLTKKHRGIIGNSFYTQSFLAQFTGQEDVIECQETIHNVLVPVTEKSGSFILAYGTAPGQKANRLPFIFAISLMLLVFVVVGMVSRQNVNALLERRNNNTRRHR